MLELLHKKVEIENAQLSFMNELNRIEDNHGSIKVGYQGGSEYLDVSWNNELGIWWGSKKTLKKTPRYWNAFGNKEPEWNSKRSHIITCEINPPLNGINRTVQGAFAVDEDSNIYVLHRGKIGGGRKGVDKAVFVREFRGEWANVRDGNKTNRLALVAQLESPRFVHQVADFIHQVDRIKTVAVQGVVTPRLIDGAFSPEFSGKKIYALGNSDIQANCNHGIVTNELAEQLEKMGVRVGNSQFVDLYTLDDNKATSYLFEVKTSAISSNYYGAIGQLMYHSVQLSNKPKLVGVFPEDIDKVTRRILEELGIECLTYKWDGNKVKFARLSRFKK